MSISFYSATDPHGEFSNFYGSKEDKHFKLVIDEKSWLSTEHYYQAQKFLGSDASPSSIEYAKAIREADTANKAFVLARQKKLGGYQTQWKLTAKSTILLKDLINQSLDEGIAPRTDWNQIKDEVMLNALEHKFSQNPKLAKKLLETGTSQIVEASPRDSYWGSGADGLGLNKLGQLLIIVREKLKHKEGKIPVKLKIVLKKSD